MRTLSYIGAFLSGAVAGAALGVLLAPEKGSETQKKLTDAVDEFCKKHNIKLTHQDINDFVEKLHHLVKSGACCCAGSEACSCAEDEQEAVVEGE